MRATGRKTLMLSIKQAEKILGVRHDAGEKVLHAAYKERAREHHPDAGGSAEAFEMVGNALEVLRQYAHQQQWGTSSSAYGSHVGPAPKLIEHKP